MPAAPRWWTRRGDFRRRAFHRATTCDSMRRELGEGTGGKRRELGEGTGGKRRELGEGTGGKRRESGWIRDCSNCCIPRAPRGILVFGHPRRLGSCQPVGPAILGKKWHGRGSAPGRLLGHVVRVEWAIALRRGRLRRGTDRIRAHRGGEDGKDERAQGRHGRGPRAL